MSKFFAVASLLALAIGVAGAEEFDGTVKSINGDMITIVKAKAKGSPKGTKGEQVVLTTAANVKVSEGTFNKKAKSYTVGEPLASGLQNAAFAKKNTKVHITTNADNKVTDVLVLAKKKKKTN